MLIDDSQAGAEMIMLSSAFIGGSEAVKKVLNITIPEHFQDSVNRLIWRAILRLHRENRGVDNLNAYNLLNTSADHPKMNREECITAANKAMYDCGSFSNAYTSTSANIVECAKRLNYLYVKRNASNLYTNLAKQLTDGQIEMTETLQNAMNESTKLLMQLQERKEKTFAEQIDTMLQNAIDRKNNVSTKMVTGITELDDVIGGLFKHDLIIIGARASMGKTDIGINILYNVAKAGHPVAFMSIEMDEESVTQRLTALDMDIFRFKFRTGAISDDDISKIEFNKKELAKTPICYVNQAVTIETLRNWVEEKISINKIELLLVDYLGMIHSSNPKLSREQQVSQISSGLKRIALDYHIPVVCISQLNRSADSREGQRPQLSDLRDSGSIEQDADVVIMLYRESYYKQQKGETIDFANVGLDIHVFKNRQGETGLVNNVLYDMRTGRIGGEYIPPEPTSYNQEGQPTKQNKGGGFRK